MAPQCRTGAAPLSSTAAWISPWRGGRRGCLRCRSSGARCV